MFEDLNPEQRAAVFHDGSPLLIVAGAGTGKTKTLVSRVVRLIDDGVDPQRILLLTFTRRAASEMLGRVTAASPHRSAGQVWGGTFHAVANRLLRSGGAGAPADFTVLDQSDTTDLIGVVRTELGLGERGTRFPRKETIASLYSRMVNSQAKLDEVLERDYPWIAEHGDDLRSVFTAYTDRKRANRVLDFDDLLLFWRGLTASPTAGPRLRELFDHILVDEYQDTNPIQADILGGMVGPSTTVCAVGDDAQAIYGFRSATVANMWTFADRFPGASTVTLEQNYRSTTPILDLANAVLHQHPTVDGDAATGDDPADVPVRHLRKELWSTTSHGPLPVLAVHHDEGDQSRAVADAVLDARERGVDLHDQAVLFRTGHHADHLELELTRRDIPYVKFGGLRYLEAAHVKDLLSLLRILENPSDQLAWHRVLDTIDGIGPATIRRLDEELAIADPAVDSLDRFLADSVRVPGRARSQVTELIDALGDCRTPDDTSSGPGPADQVHRLARFCAEVFPTRYENAAARLADLDQLAATASAYQQRSRFLAELTLDPPARTGDLAGPPHLDDDWLTLSTIHSAKGGEWTNVHLLHAADGNIPSDMAIGDRDGLAEELRLLYVALTRARTELTVHVPLRYHVDSKGFGDRHLYAQPSRFLDPVRHLIEERSRPVREESAPVFDTIGVADEVDALLTGLWS